MKKYRNKDFVIYRVTAKGYHQWVETTKWITGFINEFNGIPTHSLEKKYDLFSVREAKLKHITKDYGVMFPVVSDSHWFIIPKESTKLINYFENNVPKHLIQKRKQLIGLQFITDSRDQFNEDFDGQMKFLEHRK
ncbi:hypothetical protein COB55_03380 [Candidatus Wolfebacteria bacterium]|nr:MAG: hypothetical protein COB55_03380 [Candidatus Wolfebacteria bacterium]